MVLMERSIKHSMRRANTDVMHKTILLLLLQQQGRVTTRQLAALFYVKISAISELIKKLEIEGLITKEQGEDKRIKYIAINSTGQKYLEKLNKKISNKTETFFSNLTNDETYELSRLLNKLFTQNT